MKGEFYTDVDLIKDYSFKIGCLYEEAKNLYLEAPIQTLITLRSIVSILCKEIGSELSVDVGENDIFDSINHLMASNKLSSEIIDKLHEIRMAGNQAAHKEKFNLKNPEFVTLALNTLKNFCSLILLLRTSRKSEDELIYQFNEEAQSSLKDLSYKALFDNDTDAKYKVGMALIEVHNKKIDEFSKAKIENKILVYKDEGHLQKAVDLLGSAAIYSNHKDSIYEYAYFLIHGIVKNKDVEMGVALYRRAAYMGHVGAKAAFGYYALNDPSSSKVEIDEALENLETAASHYDPIALVTLSNTYIEGKHVKKDMEKAIDYLHKSAEAGYPESQYKLAVHYQTKERNHDLYQKYLNLAVDSGYHPAYLNEARALAKAARSEEDYELTISAYEKYIEVDDDPTVIFELGSFILKSKRNDYSGVKYGLNFLLVSYRHTKCPKPIAKQIEIKSKKCLDFLYRAAKLKDLSEVEKESLTKHFMQFDSNGKPFKTALDVYNNIESIYQFPHAAEDKLYKPQKIVAGKISRQIGRNDTCPLCSSGKKYKKCCMQ